MTLFKFKKDIGWISEVANCVWFAILIAYFGIMLVLQAIGACTHPNTPFIFGWPGMVWPAHPVWMTFIALCYAIISGAVFIYGEILTESRGENDKKLGRFYANAGCMMVLGPVFNWTILTFAWLICLIIYLISLCFIKLLRTIFYDLPIYFVSADERKQKKAEEAQQRKAENDIIVKKLIKDFDRIRK